METATSEFSLVTQGQALCFLAAFTVDQYKLQDSVPWRNCPPSTCDAYTFFDGSIDGYLSFGRPPDGDRWVVKSLKLNRRQRR
jgi:hypothetical protein